MSADGQTVLTKREDGGVVLRPSLGEPVGLLLFGAFIGLVGLATFAAGGLSTWWAFMPAFALSGFSIWSVTRALRNRRLLALEVTPYSLSMGRTAVTRKEVAAVRRYSELMFKGVRIDLEDGRWLGIHHHHHHPRKVLRALRKYGYPVEKE